MVDLRQIATFGLVGVAAAVAHYGCLIALVERWQWRPVPATLVGYVAGGLVSYYANRWLTFNTNRLHRSALPRFGIVAGVGFGVTWLSMATLVGGFGMPYVLAQLISTAMVMLWSFCAHKIWTFAEVAPP